MTITWIENEGEENEITHQLPARYEICDNCSGHGKSSAHLGAYTSSEFAESFPGEEADAYFNGDYDRQCSTCKGTGKVQVIDEDRIPEDILKRYETEQRAIAEVEAEAASERRYFERCAMAESGCYY